MRRAVEAVPADAQLLGDRPRRWRRSPPPPAWSRGTRCRRRRPAARPAAARGRPRCRSGWPGCAAGPAAPARSIAATTVVVDDRRRAELAAAVHHPVPDRGRARSGRPRPSRRAARRRGRPRPRPARRSARPVPLAAAVSPSKSRYFTDDDPQLSTSTRSSSRTAAWMAVIATVLTMSLTVAPRDRSLTGRRRPCMTGPTATAPAERCTALYVLLPVFRSGKTKTVARPATALPGSFVAATARVDRRVVLDRALDRQVGAALADQGGGRGDLLHVGARRRSCPSSRTAWPPAARCRTGPPSRAEDSAMSASWAASGSGLTAQSP